MKRGRELGKWHNGREGGIRRGGGGSERASWAGSRLGGALKKPVRPRHPLVPGLYRSKALSISRGSPALTRRAGRRVRRPLFIVWRTDAQGTSLTGVNARTEVEETWAGVQASALGQRGWCPKTGKEIPAEEAA